MSTEGGESPACTTATSAAGLAVEGWRRIFDLDPLMLVRDRQGRSAIGTLGFVFAVCARKPGG